MNPLIVLTDFSPAADNALLYAGELAQRLESELVVLHVYQIPVSMSDVPVFMVSAEELHRNADNGLNRVKAMVQERYPALTLRTISKMGEVVDEVEALTNELHPYAIVMGKHNASGMERLLFGSTTVAVVRHARVPVISIPPNISKFHMRNVALAADHNTPVHREAFLKELLDKLQVHLHVVHVQEGGKDHLNLRKVLPGLNPIYKTIHAEDFFHGIEHYVHGHHIDMLIVFPHEHGLMDRIFHKTHTTELVQKIDVPVLCIPEKMK